MFSSNDREVKKITVEYDDGSIHSYERGIVYGLRQHDEEHIGIGTHFANVCVHDCMWAIKMIVEEIESNKRDNVQEMFLHMLKGALNNEGRKDSGLF